MVASRASYREVAAIATAFDTASKKLAPFIHAGTVFVAALPVQDCWSDGGTSRLPAALRGFLERRGLDPSDDVLNRVDHAWLGLTEERLVLAKQKQWFGALSAKHLLLDVPRTDCRIEWYDADLDSRVSARRVLFLELRDGRYAFVRLMLSALVKQSEIAEMRAAADTVVEWFGPNATEISAPD